MTTFHSYLKWSPILHVQSNKLYCNWYLQSIYCPPTDRQHHYSVIITAFSLLKKKWACTAERGNIKTTGNFDGHSPRRENKPRKMWHAIPSILLQFDLRCQYIWHLVDQRPSRGRLPPMSVSPTSNDFVDSGHVVHVIARLAVGWTYRGFDVCDDRDDIIHGDVWTWIMF